ncbi:MAG TPA: dienelactone hydrolase family protein [Thermoplasmata archaeon]|nr:dienelactone hydrolase family protein [Thermoplasmata archaeon]
MTDEDLLHSRPNPEFGSGVIGVCDICGRRQAVIVLQKERYQLCVLDFLNKAWINVKKTPGAPLPPYRSERVWFPTRATASGSAPAIMLSPTKVVKHPVVLVTPDVYGLTTGVLDAAIRFAREGFEVLVPDLTRTPGIGPATHLSLRFGARTRGGVPADGRRVAPLVELFRDGLKFAKTRTLADPGKSAVFGESYGGSLGALVAAQEPSLTALALAYPVPIRPAGTLRALGLPTLIVGGGSDPYAQTFFREAREATQGATTPLEVIEFPGARHHFLARDLPAYNMVQAEAAWSQVVAFLRRQLLPPPPKPPAPPVARPTGPTPGATAVGAASKLPPASVATRATAA